MDAILELFSFRGRANRLWYFWHTMLDGVVAVGLISILLVMMGVFGGPAMILPVVGVGVAALVAGFAITVKRLHDLGRPGWHWLLLLIPIYNFYLTLVLLFRRGTFGANAYGPDPLTAPERAGYLEA